MRADAGSLPPLVGRDDDLARLRRLALGDGGRVVVSGDAGIGKTRLLAELAATAAGEGWRVVTGHCVGEAGADIPYLPFAEVFDELASGDDALLADHPAVGGLLAPGRDRVDRATVVATVHRALEEAAEAGPLLVVLEDLHWADESSRDLVTTLLTRGFRGRVGLVVSYRSDDVHRRHPLRQTLTVWSRIPGLHRLDLGGLDQGAMADLVQQRRGDDLTPAEVRRVVQRAEGNAFFAEELAAATALGHPGAGADLSRLLLVRLDALDEAHQQVVRTAAASGRRIGHDLLARVCGLAPADLEAALRSAIEHHVLVPSGPSGYTFRHALLAESVYDDLLPGERVRLHRAYAEALAADPALGTPADLARHAEAAGDRDTAARASVEAGAQALRVGGPAEALQHFGRALGLLEGDAEVDEVALQAVTAAVSAGRLDFALALLRSRLDRVADRAPLVRAEMLARMATVARLTEEQVDRVALTAEGLTLAPDDTPVRAALLAARAEALVDAGRDEEAADVAEEALDAAVRHDLSDLKLEVNGVIARIAERQGDPEESLRRLQTVVRDNAGATDLSTVRAKYQIASIHYRRSGLEQAQATYTQAVELARRAGLQWAPYGVDARLMAATAAYERGDWDGAMQLLDHAGEGAPALQAAQLDAAAMYVRAGRGEPPDEEAYRRIRRVWEADGLIAIQSASATLDAWGYAGDVAAARRTRTELVGFLRELWRRERNEIEVRLAALLLGHLAAAPAPVTEQARAAVAEEGRELLAEGEAVWPRGTPGLEGRAWLARLRAEHARLGARLGLGEAAPARLVELWREPVALFGEQGAAYEEARSRARLAAALLAAGRRAEAEVEAATARAVAEGLGARPLLAELSALGGQAPPRARGAEPFALTPREHEVLRLVAQGRSNGQIGKALFISTKTASVHVSNILGKLGVTSRGEAVAEARTRGLLTDPPEVSRHSR